MFRALLGNPKEALHKRDKVYCLRVMSVGCTRIEVPLQLTDITRMQCTKCRLSSASWGWASNARNMQRPLILNKLNEKWITLVSLYWYTMMHGQQNIQYSVYCITQIIWTLLIRIANYPDRLGLSGKDFRTRIVLHLFMAYIFPPLSNTYKELCVNLIFVRKYKCILKQLFVEFSSTFINRQCSLISKKNLFLCSCDRAS
jgi:hypothetical protein